MVELLALPFLLEMVFLLLRGLDEAKREHEAVLFCLFGGILFCLKMTNIVYLVPLVLLYLWKIRKYLTPKLFSGMSGDGGDSRQCVPDLQWDSDEKSGLSLL